MAILTIDFRILEEIENSLEYIIEKEDLDELLESLIKEPLKGELLLLEGIPGTWENWRKSSKYKEEILSFEDFEERRTHDGLPVYEVTYNKQGKIKEVEVRVAHHDGVNYYHLTPLEFVKKEKLRKFILENEEREELNEALKEGWNTTISKASKDDLQSYIEFNY